MYVTDMLVTLEKVTANSGKAQLMACDLRTSQEELPIEDE